MKLLYEKLVPAIKLHEGFSATAYPDDSASTPDKIEYSIGYGHQIKPGEDYLYNATLSVMEAEQLLMTDLDNIYSPPVKRFIENNNLIPANDYTFSAITHLAYCIGAGFLNKSLGTALKTGDTEKIKQAWSNTGIKIKGQVIAARVKWRQWEQELFFTSENPITSIINTAKKK
jgi:GH24 family phage-related lysozyme (muramidase)